MPSAAGNTPATLADALRAAATLTPGRELLVDGTVRLNCRTLHSQACVLAAAMMRRAPVGSVVSFMLPNWYEAAIVYHAATLAGMVANPILPSLRDHELRFILADSQSQMIFVPAWFAEYGYTAMLERVTSAIPDPPDVVVVRGEPGSGQLRFTDLLGGSPADGDLPALDPASARMIMYTSGTTGRPKGVLHSHDSIGALIAQIGEHWNVEPGDRFLVPSPIAHIGGSIYAFECPLLLGTTAVLQQRWNADEAVQLMLTEHCTHMAGATPFLEQLLAAAESAGTRMPELKVFICGGAAVPPALIRRAAQYFERAVVTRVYGSTEVPVTTIGAPDDADRAAETDGRAGVAHIRIVDHAAAPPGSGEILVRGPQMLLGYVHPEDGADSFDDDGYFRTGDIGRLVDGRHLVVTGRAKDIIIRNGENISPKEVEDLLLGMPGVTEAAVVGVPDPRTGERACAVLVCDAVPSPDVATIGDYLNGCGLARYKAPEKVVVWERLPKNDAGKVLKHQIRARLGETNE